MYLPEQIEIQEFKNIVKSNDIKSAKKFIKYKLSSLSEDYDFTLRVAIQEDNSEILQLLLESPFIDPSFYNNTPIIEAAKHKSIKCFKLLLEDDRVDPTDSDYEAIIAICVNGNMDMFELIATDHRIEWDFIGDILLNFAILNQQFKIVKRLLSYKVIIPNDDTVFDLCKGCKEDIELLKYIITKYDINLDKRDPSYIELAAENGLYNTVKYFVEDYCMMLDAYSYQSLIVALENKYFNVVFYLFDKELIKKSLKRESPKHYNEIEKLLFEKKVNNF